MFEVLMIVAVVILVVSISMEARARYARDQLKLFEDWLRSDLTRVQSNKILFYIGVRQHILESPPGWLSDPDDQKVILDMLDAAITVTHSCIFKIESARTRALYEVLSIGRSYSLDKLIALFEPDLKSYINAEFGGVCPRIDSIIQSGRLYPDTGFDQERSMNIEQSLGIKK